MWALLGSNQRPLPCEGRKAGRSHWALGRNPLGYKGFCAQCVALFRAVLHPLAYFLPTSGIRTTGSSSQPTTSFISGGIHGTPDDPAIDARSAARDCVDVNTGSVVGLVGSRNPFIVDRRCRALGLAFSATHFRRRPSRMRGSKRCGRFGCALAPQRNLGIALPREEHQVDPPLSALYK